MGMYRGDAETMVSRGTLAADWPVVTVRNGMLSYL